MRSRKEIERRSQFYLEFTKAPDGVTATALHEVQGALPELRASLDRAEADDCVIFPEWFLGMQLARLDCFAISDVVTPIAH